ncbi:MAG: hypothetical protein CVU38_06380 [Chloroflexi bacterium HGW-Chloroflexi-1]|nr:MAG: hypothetical protein CVU38_06380 [Chloroflexi bacterium HGW-Chloroflexi-1]
MKKLRKSNWLLTALITGVVLLALAGVALLGAYFYLSRDSKAEIGWVNPLDTVHAEMVAPDLAVLPLAGEPDDRVIRAVLDAGEIETAYAGLAYSVLLPDTLRSGHWLLLANHYQGADPARALICYGAALDQVALSPTLSDVARADVSLQVARGFTALDKPRAARLALAQAENIARYSLSMLPAQRRATLTQVVVVYRDLGDAQTAAAIQGNLENAIAGPGIKLEQGPQLLPGLRGSVVLPGAVSEAFVARQAAAASMAARWLNAPSGSRAELAGALGKALMAEDAARAAFYAGADDLPLPDRLALLHDQVAWLTIKYRVARGAYGISLAPAWEEQVAEIQAALVDAYTNLINGYGQQLDTLSPAEAAPARVELLRQGVLWTRLGLFPDHTEEALAGQLGEAASQLWTRQGGAGLTIVVQENQGQRFYLLSGSETARPGGVGG